MSKLGFELRSGRPSLYCQDASLTSWMTHSLLDSGGPCGPTGRFSNRLINNMSVKAKDLWNFTEATI